MSYLRRYFFPLIIVLILVVSGWFIFKAFTKPLSGEAVSALNRDHVTDISNAGYNSNPPTSGPHFAAWAKPGIYDEVLSDGYLIHSLEHGYVILSFDCAKSISNFKFQILNSVYAHEGEEPIATASASESAQPLFVAERSEPFTPENAPKVVALPDAFETESCKSLARNLANYLKVAKKVIVVPHPGMDKPIALTAWGRILKLDKVDDSAIRKFITTFENRGPEQTKE